MTTKTEMASSPFDTLVFRVFLCQFIQIGIQDGGAIEFNQNLGAMNRDFLVVPFTRRFEEAALGWLQFVEGAMVLGILEF